MTGPLPPYPPGADTWQFAPPPIARRWWWAAVVGTVVAAVLGTTGLVLLVQHGTDDFPASFDDPEVIDVVESECDRLADVVAGTPVTGDAVLRAAAVRAQNGAVTTFVQRLRGIDALVRDADQPLDRWIADWETLVGAREAYATELAANGSARFSVPVVDGRPIDERMDDVAQPFCEVPEGLLEPDEGISRPV